MENFANFLSFFTRNDIKLSHKTITGLSIFLLIILLDIQLGFSEHYFNSNKIDEIKNINIVIANPSTDSKTKNDLILMRNEIMQRDNIYSFFFNSFREVFSQNSKAVNKGINNTVITDNNDNILISPIRNNLFFFMSICGALYLTSMAAVFIHIVDKRMGKLYNRIFSSLLLFIIANVACFSIYYLAGKIPMIYNDTWAWNYILNFGIQIIFIHSIIFVSKRIEKIEILNKS
ncbi:hypothetical protein [Elizabethkingia meningoseptica]|uniref:hypothetical protein n=1 Tax=Elizabethkingia meningoseptica TaxID=238 RepID=UPI0018C2530B|nr:hypothetical protein [Elizabethkingia meningoseptica]MBG0515305.1 hypothetical protein [Elizabethkingia meningoseptica]